MLELYGLTPWNRGAWCLYRVAGKKHNHDQCTVQWNGHEWTESVERCRPGRYSHLWDHVGMWHDSNGQLVITTEPYHTPESVAEDIALCERIGVTCEVGAESPYYPGSTTLFIFRRGAA